MKLQGSLLTSDIHVLLLQPTNILLGANFDAKLSDFGLSKVIDKGVSHVSSEVRGTFGYVDPEYRQNHRVNAAGDVYSFGIVLLQILSGKRVINMNVRRPMSLDKMVSSFTTSNILWNASKPPIHLKAQAHRELSFSVPTF